MKNAGTVIVIALAVVLVLVLVGGIGLMGLGGYAGMGPGMMGGSGGYGMMGRAGIQGGFGYNPLGGILSLVFGALVIAGIVLLVLGLVRAGARPAPAGESALDILKARYAKGEITKEQFDAMKPDLQ